METVTLTLTPAAADKIFAAVGRHLSKGDVSPVDGQSQFSTALAAVCGGAVNGTPAVPAIAPAPTMPATAGKR